MPLTDLDNNNLGTLCVIDQKPRDLDDHQKQAPRTIAKQVITNFELRRALNTSQKDLDHARHAAKAKSIFLANVSYEIREPLSGITRVTDLLKISELNPRQTRLLGGLNDSGEVLH